MAIIERKLADGSVKYQARLQKSDLSWYPSRLYSDRLDAEHEEIEIKKKKRTEDGGLTQDARSTSVDEYWDVWSLENRTETSDGWRISQDQMYRDYVRPEIGPKLMSEINPGMVGRILGRMRDPKKMSDGKIRSAATVLKVYNLMHKMFGDARAYWRMDLENPVLPAHHRPKVKEGESRYLSPVESWALLETARSHFLGPAVWLDLLAGLRCEATVALKWDCVLWDTSQILIARAWKSKVRRIEEYPKGGRQELVPMAPTLRNYLWDLRDGADPLGFVCTGAKGGMLSPSTYGPGLKRLCRLAKVPEVSPHILRHSCTELFVREGANLEDIRRLLNHASSSVTKRYMHRSDERLAGIAARVTGPMLRVVNGGHDLPTDLPTREEKGGLPDQVERGKVI